MSDFHEARPVHGDIEFSDELVNKLADEAERGYDPEKLIPRPPGPTVLANRWHEDRQAAHEEADEFSSCWCCCVYCELNNPHYAAAQRHM